MENLLEQTAPNTETIEAQPANIVAGTCTFQELLNEVAEHPIRIPDYQRPYVWDAEKVETLIKDLRTHLESAGKADCYYMGTLLFHNNAGNYDLIDGQQRLTTLLICDFVANGTESHLVKQEGRLNFYFNSPVSKKNVIDVKRHLSDAQSHWLQEHWNGLLSKLVFSVIVTQRQDDAFSFFETQNTRGQKLGVVDYLKSYHLRELKEDVASQTVFAKQWDLNNTGQFLNGLYNNFIWRNRSWKGKEIWYENHNAVLEEFQQKTKKSIQPGHVKVFPSGKNRLAHSLQYSNKSGLSMATASIAIQSKSADLPFALRQPIEKGIGFFLYTEKYTALHKYLFDEEHEADSELGKFRNYIKNVYEEGGMSGYLRDLFNLCAITFFDKFEDESLRKFAQHLDYFIGVYRVQLSSIVSQTPVRILRDKSQNLLDVISNSFTPEEVFDFILENTEDNVFAGEAISLKKDNGADDWTVRPKYKRALLRYYKQLETENLKNLKDWIQL